MSVSRFSIDLASFSRKSSSSCWAWAFSWFLAFWKDGRWREDLHGAVKQVLGGAPPHSAMTAALGDRDMDDLEKEFAGMLDELDKGLAEQRVVNGMLLK